MHRHLLLLFLETSVALARENLFCLLQLVSSDRGQQTQVYKKCPGS
jgi:hypothetical protein